MMNQTTNALNNKVKEFVKKYYANELLKGFFFFLCIALGLFLAIATLEYFTFFNSTVRLVLLSIFVAATSIITIFYIANPLIKLCGLGKQLTPEQIASIIGKHFPEIDDKLLNLFQLQTMQGNKKIKSSALLEAAIQSKSETLSPFPFIKAIPVKKTWRYAKWALIPFLFFILILVLKSEVITESTKRVVNYDVYYEKPAPYQVTPCDSLLETFQNEDYTLEIKVSGEELPQEIFIQYNNVSYKCIQKSNTLFEYTFTNLQRNVEFQLSTAEFLSQPFTLTVLPKPLTISYVLELEYPLYTQKIAEVIENNGDATVPEGTQLTWKIYAKNTDHIQFLIDSTQQILESDNENFEHTATARETFAYSLVNTNQYLTSEDTLSHVIHIIKDTYPEIAVDQQVDTIFADRIYFKGNISDDYGFTALHFVYTKYDESGNVTAENATLPIAIKKGMTIQDFYFYFDAGTLQLEPGEKVEYYFEISDNDGVNGAKKSKTTLQQFTLKTAEQIEQELKKENSSAKSEMEDLIKESSDLIKEIEKLQQQLLQQQQPNWQDKQKLEQLAEQFKELQEKIESATEKQELNQFKEEQFKNPSEEILKKQQELQQRMANVLTDEMKEMMEKMQQMMEQFNKDQMQDAMNEMKMSSEDINESLDQQLQLFKQLEFEKQFEETLEKMRNTASEQRKLAEQSKNKEIGKEQLQQKQKELQNEFNQLKEDVKALQQLNQQLEEPTQMSEFTQEKQEISNEMQKANESLQKNNRQKASDSQNSAADKMDELADKMEQEKNEEENDDIAEDIETLRQILDNLIKISMLQEKVMGTVKVVVAKSVNLNETIKDQYLVQDYMRLIDDSLSALARRQPSVQPFIQKEVTKIRDYLNTAQEKLVGRSSYQSRSNQQFALTSMNNLALMLAESLKEMNQKKRESDGKCNKSGGKGSSSCSKPGGKKSKPQSARELQQQLNRQMEALKKSLEQGQKPQGSQQQGMPGMQQMSEQFAKMAAQQEAIRKMMQDYNSDLKSSTGSGNKGLEQMIKEMEATERELVNRVLSQNTINRQKQIETRLLESEKAQMERDKEDKRESTEALKKYQPTPPEEWKIDQQSKQQMEMLKTIPASLQYYYKEKINRYFYLIEE